MPVTLHTPVEDLVEDHPAAIRFLADRGILCVACGEAFWGTLGELMAQKGVPEPGQTVRELNDYLAAHEAHT